MLFSVRIDLQSSSTIIDIVHPLGEYFIGLQQPNTQYLLLRMILPEKLGIGFDNVAIILIAAFLHLKYKAGRTD